MAGNISLYRARQWKLSYQRKNSSSLVNTKVAYMARQRTP